MKFLYRETVFGLKSLLYQKLHYEMQQIPIHFVGINDMTSNSFLVKKKHVYVNSTRSKLSSSIIKMTQSICNL